MDTVQILNHIKYTRINSGLRTWVIWQHADTPCLSLLIFFSPYPAFLTFDVGGILQIKPPSHVISVNYRNECFLNGSTAPSGPGLPHY